MDKELTNRKGTPEKGGEGKRKKGLEIQEKKLR